MSQETKNVMSAVPVCSDHLRPLRRAEITQGERSLGFLWVCPCKGCAFALEDAEVSFGVQDDGKPVVFQESFLEHAKEK